MDKASGEAFDRTGWQEDAKAKAFEVNLAASVRGDHIK